MSLAEFAGDTPQQSDDLPTMPREVMEGEEDFRYERGGGHRGREGDRYDRGPRSGEPLDGARGFGGLRDRDGVALRQALCWQSARRAREEQSSGRGLPRSVAALN